MLLNLLLWVVGLALLGAGIAMIRGPLARYRQLQETDANLRKYEAWRGGGRRTAVVSGVTGADEMKAQMRQRAQLWGGVAAAGVVLIVLGFIVR
jgi:uncharacterized membrane protein HdeD (DUF308 family)